MSTNFLQKKSTLILLVMVLLASIFWAYSNHFDNAFQFDDSHTIEQNKAIQSIDVVRFFTDGSTFSSLPVNQSYRPLTTLENAIDYAISGELNPRPFHVHIFISFLLCCLLIYAFTRQLQQQTTPYKNPLLALIVVAIFGLLCANAETVNYIIQRAEIVSGIFILLGLIFYIKGGLFKRFHLYLIFPFIGFFSKEMAFVFAPLLFLYVLLFEENVYLLHVYKSEQLIKSWRALKRTLPAILFTAVFLVFYAKMLPPSFSSGGLSRYEYLITQPWVMCHYILTFFYPYNLSADTDWTTFQSMGDYRAILGVLIVLGLIWLALKASKNEKTKLFSFGLLWFFIALLPTSSIVPFSEVLNDHRTFIPYIGLTIAVVFGLRYLLSNFIINVGGKLIVAVVLLGFLGANAYGVHERNKVWKTDESLWKDVTIKSPNNGRGLMNYGLTLMKKGDYANAEIYFNKTLRLLPTYPYVYINLGVLKQATGHPQLAEQYFKQAILMDSTQHNAWYYYGEFLLSQKKYAQALESLLNVEQISPAFMNTPTYLMQAYNGLATIALGNLDFDAAKVKCQKALEINPSDAYTLERFNRIDTFKIRYHQMSTDEEKSNFYVDLSLEMYNDGLYTQCITLAQKANKFMPSANAYNNICSAYNQLQDYVSAIKACQEAIKLNPQHVLVKGNLGYALQHLKN